MLPNAIRDNTRSRLAPPAKKSARTLDIAGASGVRAIAYLTTLIGVLRKGTASLPIIPREFLSLVPSLPVSPSSLVNVW